MFTTEHGFWNNHIALQPYDHYVIKIIIAYDVFLPSKLPQFDCHDGLATVSLV